MANKIGVISTKNYKVCFVPPTCIISRSPPVSPTTSMVCPKCRILLSLVFGSQNVFFMVLLKIFFCFFTPSPFFRFSPSAAAFVQVLGGALNSLRFLYGFEYKFKKRTRRLPWPPFFPSSFFPTSSLSHP